MADPSLILQIGNIQLDEFATPEVLPMGGSQAIAVHEFPGGARDIQTFGAFPRTINWTGIFQGPNALEDSLALDQARAQGQEVKLLWGPAQWLGVIAKYLADLRNQWLVHYQIEFEPRVDLTGQAATPPGTVTPEATLADTQNSLNNYVNAPPSGITMPPTVTSSIATMNSTITSGLQDSGGIIANLSSGDSLAIQASISGAQSSLGVLINASDSASIATGLDLQAYLGKINLLVTVSAPKTQAVVLINPNLFALAAQYLGDATLWQDIATPSGLLDPQPIGTFTVQIPVSL